VRRATTWLVLQLLAVAGGIWLGVWIFDAVTG